MVPAQTQSRKAWALRLGSLEVWSNSFPLTSNPFVSPLLCSCYRRCTTNQLSLHSCCAIALDRTTPSPSLIFHLASPLAYTYITASLQRILDVCTAFNVLPEHPAMMKELHISSPTLRGTRPRPGTTARLPVQRGSHHATTTEQGGFKSEGQDSIYRG